jgi:hypothetical protein
MRIVLKNLSHGPTGRSRFFSGVDVSFRLVQKRMILQSDRVSPEQGEIKK